MSDVINGVPRELLERICSGYPSRDRADARDELRALLTAQPQASALSCVCVEPELPGIHRNDAPCDSNLPQASAAQSAPDEREADIRLMVDRFLSWPIPETLKADNCATMPGYPHRTGTNLMNADEAKQMLEHVISGANRYAEIESVDLGMKLPCEVKLPGGMTIGKGCTLSTLLLAMRSRSDDEPWRQRFGVPVPFDPSLINLANSIKTQAKPNEQAEREAFEALRDCKGFDYFDGAYWLRAITEVPDEKALVNADWELWQAATAWQRTQSAGVPDTSELQRVIYNADYNAKRMLDADSFWWSEIATIRVEFERFMRSLAAAPAQPTQPALTVWEGPMPESNGKSNFTAVLMRKGDRLFDGLSGGMTIARSEYPDRVRYEADCVRYLIGELQEEPCIIDYDADKHSGYSAPAQPAAQDQGERYTCIGKGGNYELVGYARLAGELRGMLGGLVPDLAIYRSDTDYFARTRQDFKERMEPIDAASTGQEV